MRRASKRAQSRRRKRRPAGGESRIRELGPVIELLSSWWALERALNETSKRSERDRGITGPQTFILRIVQMCPGATQADLSRLMHLHPSTLRAPLRRLVDRGLLHADDDARDGRLRRYRLTKKALAGAFATAAVETAVARVLTRSTNDERRLAEQTLSILRDALEEAR